MQSNKQLYIASLSGGRDSTAMTIKLLELNKPLDYIIFCDTGYEFPLMLEYLELFIIQNTYDEANKKNIYKRI